MQITIKGKHLEVTETLRDYINKKMERIKRHFDHFLEAHVTLSVEKYRHIVEVVIQVHGITLKGKEETKDMFTSIDKVMEKIERQVRRYKGKITRHKPAH